MAKIHTDLNRFRKVYPFHRTRRINPQVSPPILTLTANYTAKKDDFIFNVSASSAITITLLANPQAGESFIVKDISGSAQNSAITVSTSDSTLIDGASSSKIGINFGSSTFVFDGNNWHTY